jgi:5-methylcytosine-specific restriction endonuclease McrA
MTTQTLAAAAALSDRDLLLRLGQLAAKEREASAELVTHLAVLDARPDVYAAQGYGSLFSYCTQALRLSEDAACNRIEAARACRRFPLILELLVSGSLSLTTVRLLARHLTLENHEGVLVKAAGRTRHEIEALVAELAPRPDVTSAVRKLRSSAAPAASSVASQPTLNEPPEPTRPIAAASAALIRPTRPSIQATAPERYRVQFTVGPETHEKLRRVQALLRREIPDGDPGAIFDRAVTLLLEKVERTKLAAVVNPRSPRPIRPGTDSQGSKATVPSRHIPREVRRAVWRRDGGQCAFVASGGRRCTERAFLELHHVQPYARQGSATVSNISLRCRRHNQYEAELAFGPRREAACLPTT